MPPRRRQTRNALDLVPEDFSNGVPTLSPPILRLQTKRYRSERNEAVLLIFVYRAPCVQRRYSIAEKNNIISIQVISLAIPGTLQLVGKVLRVS